MKIPAFVTTALASMVIAVPTEAQAQCKYCEQCPGDPFLAWTNDHGGFWQVIDPLYGSRCFDYFCGDMLPCHPSEEQEDVDVLAEVDRALSSADVQSIPELLASRGADFSLVPARRLLLLRSRCSQAAVALRSLTDAQWQELEAEAADRGQMDES